MDFTPFAYKEFLEKLLSKNYTFLTFKDFLKSTRLGGLNLSLNLNLTILRHDVDRLPQNSLQLAELEHSLGIKGTYYFRVVPESYDLNIMNKIAELGHEIGYHYEDVDLTIKNYKLKIKNDKDREDLIDRAYESFCKNLEMLRKNFDIKTICMHGSPRSKYDNKLIWSQLDANGKQYNYKDLGIIGEPYYDIDFNEFAYLTDTGRRWNGDKYSVRDKVESKFKFDFKSTQDIINNIGKLPSKVMFTIHPERWTDDLISWSQNLIVQNIKNFVKRFVVLTR